MQIPSIDDLLVGVFVAIFLGTMGLMVYGSWLVDHHGQEE